jgi:RNA polymerase primary sigma factor
MRSEQWSIADAVATATGSRPVHPTGVSGNDERREFLTAIAAHEALQKSDPDGVASDLTELLESAVRSNLRLVSTIAISHSRGTFMRFDDIFQEGVSGLRRAIDRFDPFRGYAFSTLATPWVRQAITRAIADQARTIRIPVHMVETINRLIRVSRTLLQELGREPTVEEIARRMSSDEIIRELRDKLQREPTEAETDEREAAGPQTVSPEKVREIMKVSQEPVSLETLLRKDTDNDGSQPGGTETFSEVLRDSAATTPDEAAVYSSFKAAAAGVLDSLTPRERRVLQLRFGLEDGRSRTLEEVGRDFNVTRERIRQIEAKALRKLRHPSRSRKLKDYRENEFTSLHEAEARRSKDRAYAIPGIASQSIARLRLTRNELSYLYLLMESGPTGDWDAAAHSVIRPLEIEQLAAVVAGFTGKSLPMWHLKDQPRERRAAVEVLHYLARQTRLRTVQNGHIDLRQVIDSTWAFYSSGAAPCSHVLAMERSSALRGLLADLAATGVSSRNWRLGAIFLSLVTRELARSSAVKSEPIS